MKKIFFLLALHLTALHAMAYEFGAIEDSIASSHQAMKRNITDEQRDSLSNSMRAQFIALFNEPSTFDYSFSKLKFCTITSPDHHVRLINWNVPQNDGTHKYVCFVLVWNNKDKDYWYTELTEPAREGEKVETKYLNEDKWLGALYYDIIPMEKKNTDTYTLLGWDGKDNMSQRKIIDALHITGKKVRLGAPIFKNDNGTKKRMLFEYSDEISASVKFYQKKKCIVLDHLSPKNPNMVGIYSDYGPDGSYDVLALTKGKWELVENADVKEFARDDDKPFINPRRN
jgi:hypothetical protein